MGILDGDNKADLGASAGAKNTDLTEGLHEDVNADLNRGPTGGAGAGSSIPAMDSKGSVGGMFAKDGPIGQIGEKLDGPFSSQGAIGSQFTDQGGIGGMIQKNMGDESRK